MKRWSLLWAILLGFATATVTLAHRPIFVEPRSNTTRANAIPISDHDISWAVYAQLSAAGEVNYYRFEGKRGAYVRLETLVPRIESLRAFGFDVALVGKGFDAAPVPFALEADEGAIVAPDAGHDDARGFDEHITQTSYWYRQCLRAQFPADGTYWIAVYDPRGRTGKYVLAIGEREVWGVQDLLQMPSIVARVREFAGLGSIEIPLIPIGLGIAVLMIVARIGALLWRSK
ncbi:MAG: hypothetical protein N2559_14295 [Anaerolineae bacterium]|nr:hypothetical protein [Anaerolineae bacterium]